MEENSSVKNTFTRLEEEVVAKWHERLSGPLTLIGIGLLALSLVGNVAIMLFGYAPPALALLCLRLAPAVGVVVGYLGYAFTGYRISRVLRRKRKLDVKEEASDQTLNVLGLAQNRLPTHARGRGCLAQTALVTTIASAVVVVATFAPAPLGVFGAAQQRVVAHQRTGSFLQTAATATPTLLPSPTSTPSPTPTPTPRPKPTATPIPAPPPFGAYYAAAPGPKCDTGGLAWSYLAQYPGPTPPSDVTCGSGYTQITASNAGAGSNYGVDWQIGASTPQNFTIGVTMNNLGSQTEGSFNLTLGGGASGGTYQMWLEPTYYGASRSNNDGSTTNFGSGSTTTGSHTFSIAFRGTQVTITFDGGQIGSHTETAQPQCTDLSLSAIRLSGTGAITVDLSSFRITTP